MENLELFVFDQNGQLIVNWDSLEMATSTEFVESIKMDLTENGYCLLTFFQSSEMITIYLHNGASSKIHHFYKSKTRKSVVFSQEQSVSNYDLVYIVEALGGKITWNVK